MTPCPAVGPSAFSFVHLLMFFVEHGHRLPFFEVFPCSIHLLSNSNNGSIRFTFSKGVLFVVDLGHFESFVVIILGTTGCKTSGSICSDNAKARQKACATCQQHVHVP